MQWIQSTHTYHHNPCENLCWLFHIHTENPTRQIELEKVSFRRIFAQNKITLMHTAFMKISSRNRNSDTMGTFCRRTGSGKTWAFHRFSCFPVQGWVENASVFPDANTPAPLFINRQTSSRRVVRQIDGTKLNCKLLSVRFWCLFCGQVRFSGGHSVVVSWKKD